MTDIKSQWLPDEEWESSILMKFQENVRSLQTIDGRLFVVLESGKVIDATDLLGEARQ